MPRVEPSARTVGWWPRHGTFVAWTAIGVGAVLTLLTPLTVGPFVLVEVVVAAVVVVRRPGGVDAGVTGVLSGAGLLMVYIAYLNRRGPGEVCRTNAAEHECTTQWSPWPLLLVGLVLVAAGVLLFRRYSGRGGNSDQGVRAAGAAPPTPEARGRP